MYLSLSKPHKTNAGKPTCQKGASAKKNRPAARGENKSCYAPVTKAGRLANKSN